MKNEIFRGIGTALATPMNLDDSIDYEAFGRLIDWQIESGINALITCGTTGESATMTEEEHKDVIRFTVERAAGRVPVVAGTGSNNTALAISMTKYACSVGADACLLVAPYYNKATQDGLIAHYTAIADASTKPLILYNIPSRTGCNLLPATCATLGKHPRIAAVKEASGNISQIVSVAAMAGEDMDLYSGNDDQIVPILAMGGIGCISVMSNLAPKETLEICKRFFAGDVAGAAKLQCKLLNLIRLLFCEVNPIPVKAGLAAMGYGEGGIRLPLTPMSEGNREKLLLEMKKLGVLA